MRAERISYKSFNGKTDMIVLKPERQAKDAPGMLWIHGGGYLTGLKEMVYFSRARSLVEKFGAVVFSPGYRLSLLNPYPSGLLDCISALEFICDNAHEFKINKDQIMIGGESAGGGLAVSVSLFMRDLKGVNLAYQMPLYPMISCFDTVTSKHNFEFPWNTFNNHLSWKLYGRKVKSLNPYFSPSISSDLSNLPPAYSFVGIREPFYAETVDYFIKLRKCGVSADLDVYPTGFHAFDMLLPHLEMSKIAARHFEEHFDYARGHFFAPNN